MSRVCVVVLDEDNPEISRRSKVFTDTEVVVGEVKTLPIVAFCLIFQGCCTLKGN